MRRSYEVKRCPACSNWSPAATPRCACGHELPPPSPTSFKTAIEPWLIGLPFTVLLLGALAGVVYAASGVPWGGPELNSTGRRVVVALGVVAFLLAGAILGELFCVIWPGPPPQDGSSTDDDRREVRRAFDEAERGNVALNAYLVVSMLVLLVGAIVGAWLLFPSLTPLLRCFTIWAVASPWILAGLGALYYKYQQERRRPK